MADLITLRELALWTQNPEAEVAADDFAVEVIDKVSQFVAFLAGDPDPEWEATGPNAAPFDARMVALQVCKRCYENPGQVVTEGAVGPIGGDRVLDAAALLMSLTDAERATLTKYNPDGDPDGGGGVFVLRMGEDAPVAPETTLYVGDDQQVNLGDELEWMIPMFSPGDPGDPAHYPEDG